MADKVKWEVRLEDRYVKVFHSKRGLVAAGELDRDGRIVNIAFLNPADYKSNMVRMPAMSAMQNWERSILDPIINARGCSRNTARVHAGWTRPL